MPGKRPDIVAEAILDDWQTECRKVGRIAIGTDDQVRDLGPQTLDNMSEDQSGPQGGQQTFVAAAMRPDRPPAIARLAISSGVRGTLSR
jgi:hypothetical protein